MGHIRFSEAPNCQEGPYRFSERPNMTGACRLVGPSASNRDLIKLSEGPNDPHRALAGYRRP